MSFSAVKVFSSTLARDRQALGERVSVWLDQHAELTPVQVIVKQSSDQEFHCLSITLFLTGDASEYLKVPAVTPRVIPRPKVA